MVKADQSLESLQHTTSDVEFLTRQKNPNGKNISLTESLTKKQMEVLKKVREDHRFEDVWSIEGKILYKM